jgi:tyrosyl-tRNA synthetase
VQAGFEAKQAPRLMGPGQYTDPGRAQCPKQIVDLPTSLNTSAPQDHPVTERVRHAMAVSRRGCHELLPELDWQTKLARSDATGVPLRVKLGLDPTAPDIHLGHTVVLNKMRQLQDLGHNVIFLIGDFTSMIGDPSGRNATRPPLSREQIDTNARTYYQQASLVLDPTTATTPSGATRSVHAA